jgi:hypothetical protein
VNPPPSSAAWRAAISDLNMLVAQGGRERTVTEDADLLARVGIALDESRDADYGLHVMVSRPA